MAVRVKNVAANCGTVFETSANSLTASWPGTLGNIGRESPSEIKLLHSRPCRTMNPVPQSMVASNHKRCHLASPWTEALTAITMVRELVRRNAVMIVALTILAEWNGVGQSGVEILP